jgi:hypothetical protein
MYVELQILRSFSLLFSSRYFVLVLRVLVLRRLIFRFRMMLFLLNLEIISILMLSVLRGRLFIFLYLMIIVVVEAVFGLSLLLGQIRRFGNDKVIVL